MFPEHTGFPEMLDGRVKTLHPKVPRRHSRAARSAGAPSDPADHDIPRIDLVVVNLYPFQQTVARPDCSLEDAIENIDIGGPAMVRAAAKNHGSEIGGVAVVTDPDDYPAIVAELQGQRRTRLYKTRFALAAKAFTHTARYDSAISNHPDGTSEDGGNSPTRPGCSSPSTRSRTCATAKTLTRAPRSTAKRTPLRVLRPIPNCRARSCPTTTSPTPTRHGNASRPSSGSPRPASS